MGLLLTMTVVLHVALSLRIAAFNIKTFGETKMSNATLSTYIVQVGPGLLVPKEPRGVGVLYQALGTLDQWSVLRAVRLRPLLLAPQSVRGKGPLALPWLTASGCRLN